ncbi:MAG TPA: MOSC domain-containing protein, partial [Methylophaga sp.]|nr:MOSC domain-containing protein [Methylophaga sp.]
MELISINVSLPVDVQYNNKLISTGIFKKPVNKAVHVSQSGLAGDQQVDLINHGGEHKAVYGFSANHYEFWRNKLNSPKLSYGQFGENLTITELDEAKLCIGDQLQIGNCIL